MKKTGVFYGSTTGATEEVAEKIAAKLSVKAESVSGLTAEVIAENEVLILGSSTWGSGDMQDDWYDALDLLKEQNLTGKIVALFGCGDSESYGDSFCDAIGEIYNGLKDTGCKFIGAVSTDGYSFDSSIAVVDGKFVGLPIDEVNEDGKTDERISKWIEQIKPELN